MNISAYEEIRSNLTRVEERIARAARESGREPEEIKLIAVTKAQPMDRVEAAIQAGAQFLGENYPEEALEKIEKFKEYENIQWHMIGHLQSRKANIVAEHFDFMHSLDSLHIARRLERSLAEKNRTLPVLLEINSGGEESKHGWIVDTDKHWTSFFGEVRKILELKHLEIHGLMTMPPLLDNPEDVRPFFQLLRTIQSRLADQFREVNWSELSMGTSADFEIAIQEGATFVRIGEAILGSRPKRQSI
jgi:pyridoxal phosphate enzyme (YggS family)